MKNIFLFLLIVVVLLLFTGCTKDQGTPIDAGTAIDQEEIDFYQEKYFSRLGSHYPEHDKIIATINGWPITKGEMDYRDKLNQIFMGKSDVNSLFNILVEEKVILSQVALADKLPSDQDVLKDLESFLENQEEFNTLYKDVFEGLQVSSEEYWTVYEKCNIFNRDVSNNYSVMSDEDYRKNNTKEYIDYKEQENYYWEKFLKDKESAVIKIYDTSFTTDVNVLYGRGWGISKDVSITPELREVFLRLANDNRFFYIPDFEEGKPITDIKEYLFYVHTLSYETPKSEMYPLPKNYVKKIIHSHFKIAELVEPTEPFQEKYFEYDGEHYTYTHTEGFVYQVFFELTQLRETLYSDKTVYDATLNFISYDEHGGATEAELKEVWDKVINGKTGEFYIPKVLHLKYYVNESTGDLVYLSSYMEQVK